MVIKLIKGSCLQMFKDVCSYKVPGSNPGQSTGHFMFGLCMFPLGNPVSPTLQKHRVRLTADSKLPVDVSVTDCLTVSAL